MSALTISMQEKRDLEKFTRYLVLKTSQIIVQARSGEKIITKCKPNSFGTDWFNLAIQDVPEITQETKRVFSEEVLNSSVPFCIEISLRTVEGDTMVLETWSLGVHPDLSDSTPRKTSTVYNQMGILLKSLLSVTRITPAYKLSRKQRQDSYTMCYRMYMSERQLNSLGENYKYLNVEPLCTPVGKIQLSVAYRTDMAISPTQADRLSPKQVPSQRDTEAKSLTCIEKVGAFVEIKQVPISDEDIDVPFGSLLTSPQTPSSSLISLINDKTTTIQGTSTTSSGSNNENISNAAKCSDDKLKQSTYSITSTNDDFIMVDWKTPFAAAHNTSDLRTFYRECQSAPQLKSFTEDKTLGEEIGDLVKQLETFEADMHQFEDCLDTLCKSKDNT